MVVESTCYVDVIGDEAFEELPARSRAELAASGSAAGYVGSTGWVSDVSCPLRGYWNLITYAEKKRPVPVKTVMKMSLRCSISRRRSARR